LKDVVYLPDGAGEYRGNLLTVWPSTPNYSWVIPLPPGKIPFVPSEMFIGKREHNAAETAYAISALSDISAVSAAYAISALSDISAVSAAVSPDQIIRQTLPSKPGERNDKILALSRGLKFNCGLATADSDTLKQFVREWHRQALPNIQTKDFDVTLADFFHAFDRARHPLGNVVDIAAASVDPSDLPAVAERYDGIPMKRLIALCAALGAMHPEGHFFFSSHDAGRRIKVLPKDAWRLLELLQRDGVIERMERGNQFRATRYRWIGEKENSHE
jgi:hypothetical protein